MLFYFTATGNSLYVAKQLENDPISIPQELRKANRHYISDSIGIVCPLFEFEIPKLVKDFIQGSSFETDYFYLLITYGCHHGGVAQRTQAWLESIGRKADYVNTIIMHEASKGKSRSTRILRRSKRISARGKPMCRKPLRRRSTSISISRNGSGRQGRCTASRCIR